MVILFFICVRDCQFIYYQLYKSFKPNEEPTVLMNDVPKCFQEIDDWMKKHYLQLNAGKTEILVFGTPPVLQQLSIGGVFVKGSQRHT